MTSTKPARPVILVYGEVLFDTFPDGRRVLGGAPFNVAWNLFHLGTPARFVGAIGNDGPGREVLSAMRVAGLPSDGVVTVEEPTGRVVVRFVGGEPEYTIPPGQAFDQEPGAFLARVSALDDAPADWIYHGSLALRSSANHDVFRVLGDVAQQRFVDVNLRAPWYAIDGVRALLRDADVVKLNAAELAEIEGLAPDAVADPDAPATVAAARALADSAGIRKAVVVTFGAAGALAWIVPDGIAIRVAALGAEVLDLGDGGERAHTDSGDAVGAGDAFSAALLHSIAANRPWTNALAFAAAYAAGVTRLQGATCDDPTFYRALCHAATTAGEGTDGEPAPVAMVST